MIIIGYVSTYGFVAKALGSSARAVGTAFGCNPFAPIVPCHRVIRSDLSIGGFQHSTDAMSASVQRKLQLLGQEGVYFDERHRLRGDMRDRVVDLKDIVLDERQLTDEELMKNGDDHVIDV